MKCYFVDRDRVLKLLSMFVMVILFPTVCFGNSLNSKTEQVTEQNKESRFGVYRGYTKREYNGFERESKYVAIRDGTRLAVDIYHPTKDGVRAQKKLPTLVWMTWYRRANLLPDGSVRSLFGIEDKVVGMNINQARYYLEHGYTILAVDTRGSGASFGQRPPPTNSLLVYASDSYDVIEWAAAQSWSTGSVGMFGNSFMGNSQTSAASAIPPSLKAIFPGGHVYHGWVGDLNGLMHKSLVSYYNTLECLDSRKGAKDTGMDKINQITRADFSVAPVDGPRGKKLLAEAIAEHEKTGKSTYALTNNFEDGQRQWHQQQHDLVTVPATMSNIPIYSVGALREWAGASAPLLFFGNTQGPRKALVAPWTHGPDELNDNRSDAHGYYINVEGLRWFDYWLRGIDNGIMDEPLLHYALIDEDDQQGAWLATDTWPAADVQRETLFLTRAEDGVPSLVREQSRRSSKDVLTVDFTATTGVQTRYFDSNTGGPLAYPEMSNVNSKALVFTSAPLDHDIAIVGAPIVDLKMTGSAPDAQVFVYLEKVRADDGTSEFIADGKLQASWRTLLPAPQFNSFGWPQLDYSEVAVSSTPPFNSEIATIRVALKPTGRIFEKGSRIRIAITGADADNWVQDIVSPAPELTLFMGPEAPSKITLPIMHDVSKLSIKSWTDYSE